MSKIGRLSQLSFSISCLLLLAHGSHLRLQSARHVRRQEAADSPPAGLNTTHTAQGEAGPDKSVEALLATCGFFPDELPGGAVEWHTASSACSILGNYDRLLVVGDSMTRQLYEALVMLLRGDLAKGAFRQDVAADIQGQCACHEQDNQGCRVFTEAWPVTFTWLDGAPLVSDELAPCPNAPHFRMRFFHQYAKWMQLAYTRDSMAQVRWIACQHPNSLVWFAGAPAHEQRARSSDPWFKMDAEYSVRHYIGPMREWSAQCKVPPENLVWVGVHWMDMRLVPKEEWRAHQYPDDVIRYNRITGVAAGAANFTVFDTYELTKNGATLDGMHVPTPVSLAKVQRLLGMLEARQAGRDRPAGTDAA